MSGLGEWDDDAPVYDLGDAPEAPWPNDDEAPATRVKGQVRDALDGLDVASIAGSLVASTVAAEIRRQVQSQVAPVIAEAVAQVLTPERLDALGIAAAAAAEAELNPPPAERGSDPDAPPPLYYGSVDEFVRDFLVPTYRRRVAEEARAELRWSARWWESAEAIMRLEAMWRAWEHLRLDPATGVSVWFRDHGDYHMGVLMSPLGPFAKSKDTAGVDGPLPYEAPPEGLFPDVRGDGD